MKNKNLLLNFVVVLGLVAAVVGLFLNYWTGFTALDGETLTASSSALFADMSLAESPALATIAQVLLLVGAGLVVVYILLYVLEYLKVVKKTAKLRMFVAAVAVLVIIVAAVLAFVFCGNNTHKTTALGHTTVAGIKLAVGFYLTAIGTLVAGVFGALASRK